MRKKNCPGADNLEANIIDKPKNVVETNLAEQLKTLKELYEDGHLSEEEYSKVTNLSFPKCQSFVQV